MYKNSIKKISNFLVPFVEGIKYYGSDVIEHGIGTMIVLNKDGDILTCKHIAERFLLSAQLEQIYPKLINEIKLSKNKEDRKKIEKKYNLKNDSVVLSKIEFPYSTQNEINIEIKFHNYLDIALIKVKGVKLENFDYPIFSKNLPEQGQSVCKLGYAFPEYSLFEYSNEVDNIVMKNKKITNFPLFPIDGIISRHVMDEKGVISMFETTTPGLRGQSGGPIFGPDGIVYGIQVMTKHLDLNFDVNQSVKRGVENKKVIFTPFINLGVGISSTEIIKFLEENKVDFNSK